MKKKRLRNEIPNIPHEIFQEILSRLPVKPLTRFKTVCKSWHALISDPHFSDLHLKQSVNQNRINLMFLHDSHSSSTYAALDGTTSKTTMRPLICANESSNYKCLDFSASCNGLFCVCDAEDEHELFLWNPSTRESKRIPSYEIEFTSNSCTRVSVFYGLGYHSLSDDYKLVRVSMFDGVDFQTEVKIYSRNCDKWKRIRDFPYDFPHGGSGVFVCGGLHWIVSLWSNTGVRLYMVAMLDMCNESYGLIELPEFGQDLISYFDIGTLEENLVLFCCYSLELWFDIWVLKEYGKVESWTRIKITIPCITNNIVDVFAYFQPLCFLKPSLIVLRVGADKVLVYDVKEKMFWNILIPHMIKEPRRIVSFVESLVSPDAHKDKCNGNILQLGKSLRQND